MFVAALEKFRVSPTAAKFEGGPAAGVPVSSFVTDHPPGREVGLHRHPYPEVFMVLSGLARFTAAGEQQEVPGGHVVVVPAGTPHGFASAGDEHLRIVSIHPSPEVVQEELEGP